MLAAGDLLRSKSLFVLDLDGVVYAGDEAIPGAVSAILDLRRRGKRVGFLTNNSTRSCSSVAEKLTRLGVPTGPELVMTSAEAAATFLAESRCDGGDGVFVIGADELRAQLTSHGVGLAEPFRCGALLVGMDHGLDYERVGLALDALRRGVPFVACNLDANYPGPGGRIVPGCGAMVGAVTGASRRKPDYVVGKPNPYILRLLLNRLGGTERDCIVVGDTLDSDVLLAQRAGVSSVWIHAGAEQNPTAGARPDLQVANLAELVSLLSS